MKKLLILLLIINFQICFGQNTTVIEVDKPHIPMGINQLIKSLDGTLDENIKVLEIGLKEAKSNYEKFRIARNLGFLYAESNEKNKNIKMWSSLHKQGFFFYFRTGDRIYPPYLKDYIEDEAFKNILENNNKLKEEALKEAKAEYFVSLPKNYDASKQYPLIIILHGGIGDFYSTYTNWSSKEIDNNYIAVYPQGGRIAGSFMRSYGPKGTTVIKEIYNQVIQKYSVNTEQVIFAGQSAGGHLSIQLAYGEIGVKGLLLAYPVKPRDFDLKKAKEFKEKGIRITMVYGAKDQTFFEGQSAFVNLIDSAKVENQSFLYLELGHRFPDDFEEQIDKALVYLIK